jgi:hypothetical protein
VFPGQREPFRAGHLLSVRHGAYSARLTGPRAAQIAAELLADAATPDYVREPSYAEAVRAWAQATAECERLRAWRDELERRAAADPVDGFLTEVTQGQEDESRPESGELRRVSLLQQRESLAKALHRAETRARSLRSDLGLTPMSRARLGKDVASATFDIAKYWAQRDAERRAAKGAST